MNPPEFAHEDCILFSKVLPMGFVNSVAVAQHLHRRLVIKAFQGRVSSAQEIRRDRELPTGPLYFRTYLDNFDVLSVRSKAILESDEPSLVSMLQSTYEKWHVPRNEKKAVLEEHAAEIQGAWIDGKQGICRAKGAKIAKYLAGVEYLLRRGNASQKQMQMVAGGMVYLFSFRRPLMSLLNEVWHYIASFKNDQDFKPIPALVKQELCAAFFLTSLAFMNFRLPASPIVTASDASEQGGGLCASVGLTSWGSKASQGTVRGERFEDFKEMGLLVVSLFDGVGTLRVCLDALSIPLAGYISVEKDEACRRVLESHYPGCLFVSDVCSITSDLVREWAAMFPNCLAILIAGGPPCQGVSSLNASKKGAELDPRSSLHHNFKEVRRYCREFFTWCPCFFLMESVASMSPEDGEIYTQTAEVLPSAEPCHPQAEMVKRQIVEGLEPSDRKRRRAALGSLKSLVIRPATITRYQKAFNSFLTFLHGQGENLSPTISGVDSQAADYLDWLWEEGLSLSQAADCLCALQHFQPSCRKRLPSAWRLLKVWQLHELPARAPPLTLQILEVILGRMTQVSPEAALGLLVGFRFLLRTGELLNLQNRDILVVRRLADVGPKLLVQA
eukprot:s1282_g3.t1